MHPIFANTKNREIQLLALVHQFFITVDFYVKMKSRTLHDGIIINGFRGEARYIKSKTNSVAVEGVRYRDEASSRIKELSTSTSNQSYSAVMSPKE